jgi:hypothetical protein
MVGLAFGVFFGGGGRGGAGKIKKI